MKAQNPHTRCPSQEFQGARAKSSESGFTLLNMLVAMSLTAIVAGIGVGHLNKLSETFHRLNARNYVLEDLKRAQAETITEGCRGIINVAADGKSYTYGCDYLAYDPAADPHSDSVKFQRVLPENITLAASGPVIFDSRGQTVDINAIVTNITLVLSERVGASSSPFATGTLLGTGVFSYN